MNNELFLAFTLHNNIDYNIIDFSVMFWADNKYDTVKILVNNNHEIFSISKITNLGLGVVCSKGLLDEKSLHEWNDLIIDDLSTMDRPNMCGWISMQITFKAGISSFQKYLIESKTIINTGNGIKDTLIDIHCVFLPLDIFMKLCRKYVSNCESIFSKLMPIGECSLLRSVDIERERIDNLKAYNYYKELKINTTTRTIYFGKDINGKHKKWRFKPTDLKPRARLKAANLLWDEFINNITKGKKMSFQTGDMNKILYEFNMYWRGLGKFAEKNGYRIDEFSKDKQFFTNPNNAIDINIHRERIKKISDDEYVISLTLL